MKNEHADQFVVFSIQNQTYAITIEEVVEIIHIQPITEVAGVRPFIAGVINLRGKIIPVLQLRTRFGMPNASFTKKSRIIVVNDEESSIGLIVDEVKMVTRFEQEDIEPPPQVFQYIDKENFQGFAKTGDELIGILRVTKILYP